MAQQLHHGLYGMVVIVNIATMKFLPIMNLAMRRPAAQDGTRSLMSTVQANRHAPAFSGSSPGKVDLGVCELQKMAGPAMNRFVHRIIMSVLLVAALVLIWNVLGAR
jgi:hypothetical protein